MKKSLSSDIVNSVTEIHKTKKITRGPGLGQAHKCVAVLNTDVKWDSKPPYK